MRYETKELDLYSGMTNTALNDHEAHQLVSWWVLRILLLLGGVKELNDGGIRRSSRIAMLFDLQDDDDDETVNQKLEAAAKNFARANALQVPALLERNIEKISKHIGLNETEQWLLCFGAMLHNFEVLEDAVRCLDELNTVQAGKVLSVILGLPHKDIQNALSSHGTLAKSGILQIDRSATRSLDSKIDLLSNVFADKLYSSDEEVHDLIKDSVRACGAGTLIRQDFQYIDASYEMMTRLLRSSIQTKRVGANILIYGAPGTGKTELVKLLAHELGVTLFEISYIDDDGEPANKRERLKAYKVAQSFFANEKILLLFDEAEDVFDDDEASFFKPKKQSNKAWFNRMLETSPIPTVWLSNSVDSLDPAVVRRFDIVFEMPIPSKRKREELVEQAYGYLISDAMKKKIAQHEALAPALLSRSSEVLHVIKEENKDASKEAEMLLNATLEAQGHHKLVKSVDAYNPGTYNPAFVNTSINLEAVMQGISRAGSARICLYGAPGTGKSAYCRYIAEQLDRPLLLKRASDLISPFVGMTEYYMARAFEEAEQDGAALVIDEVDSFLQDRRSAQRSWEVTEVNEMLTQMEAYEGIFFATTNLMEGLDQAALRRFDMKLEFMWLRTEQSLELLQRHLDELGLQRLSSSDERKLQRLSNLAPGDFNAVRRQSRFNPLTCSADFVHRLEQECALKQQQSNIMGFLS